MSVSLRDFLQVSGFTSLFAQLFNVRRLVWASPALNSSQGVPEFTFGTHLVNENWLMKCGTQSEVTARMGKVSAAIAPPVSQGDSSRPKFCSGCGSAVRDVGAFCSNFGNRFN